MIVKLFYIIGIFFTVRFVLNKLTPPASVHHTQKKPKHRDSDDIIDAEYKVMDE